MKKLFISFAVFAVFLIIPEQAFGYDTETHAYLTQEAVSFFNNQSADRIDSKYVNYLIDGSRREDDMIRSLNHFYDPVYNRPLTGDTLTESSTITNFGLNLIKPLITTAKNWALDTTKQRSLIWRINIPLASIASILTGADEKKLDNYDNSSVFTWELALDYYAKGEKEKAFYTLGHILHLIEDMAVPEHTRNDAHADGSPYEEYADRYNPISPDNNLAKRLQGKKLIKKDSPSDYFDVLATYSNNNFFSKDTFGVQTGYTLPSVELESYKYFGGDAYYLKSDEFGEYKLAYTNSPGSLFSFGGMKIDPIVLPDYWTRLSTASVTNSAGLIDLFIKEGEKKRLALNKEPETPLEDKDETLETLPSNPQKINNGLVTNQNPVLTDNQNQEEDSNPVLFLDRTSAVPGDIIERTGSGFSPEASIKVSTLYPSGFIKEENFKTDRAGAFFSAFKINAEAEIGDYSITARDELTNKASIAKFSIVSVYKEKEEQTKNEKDKQSVDILKLKPAKCSYESNGYVSEKPIIFNEINWMGSKDSSSDEWIELYNRSSSELNISNWSVISKDGGISVGIPENTYLAPGGYYLLERTDDNSAKGVLADGFFSGAISNSKESLKILTNDCRITDEVIADSSWPAGNSSSRKTMERRRDLSWQTSSVIGGTPKAENSSGESVVSNSTNSPTGGTGGGNNSSQIVACKNTADVPDYRIIINEVAWAGGEADSSEEWIELYNPGNATVDLTGWQLTGGGGDKLYAAFLATDKIPGKGYYLLSRGSAFIPNITSDKIFSGSVNNSNETVALYSSNCNLVDIVQNTGTNWKNIGGTNTPDKRTAERVNESMWQTYQGPMVNGVYGTPKNANSKKGAILGNPANHLVISEAMVGDDKDQDAEWIELYNPTENPILLDDYSIRYKTESDSENEEYLVSRAGNIFKGKYIKPYGFFLIASSEYGNPDAPNVLNRMVDPDALYSDSVARLPYAGGDIILYNEADKSIVDEVIYTKIDPGKSWERMAAKDGLCVDPSAEETEYIGNACDKINPEDYILALRNDPFPQNSKNLLEPRLKPVIGFPSENLNVSFISNRAEFQFGWPETQGDENKVWLLKVDDEDINKDPVTGKYSFRLPGVNKAYKISLAVKDIDGYHADNPLEKEISVTTLHKTEIFESSRIEPDGTGQPKDGYFIKITPPSWPIFEESLTYRNNYNGQKQPLAYFLVFFKNSNPLKTDIVNEKDFTPLMNEGRVLKVYHKMGADYANSDIGYTYSPYISIPETTGESGNPGRILSKGFYDYDDKSITLMMDENLAENDYLTIGYYGVDFLPSQLGGGELTLKLITIDNTKIYPEKNLPEGYNQSPETPVFSFSRDEMNNLLFNQTSFIDPDSPDGTLSFESAKGDGITIETVWTPGINTNSLNPGDQVWVRLLDDFGFKSEPSFAIVPSLNISDPIVPEDPPIEPQPTP